MNDIQPTRYFQLKADAEAARIVAKAKFGGTWSVEPRGSKSQGKWRLEHVTTKRHDDYLRAVTAHRMMTDPDSDFFTGRRGLTYRIETACVEINKFADQFRDNPLYTLEWSGSDAVKSAARLRIWTQAVAGREKGADEREVLRFFIDEMERACRYSAFQSSNPINNLVEDARRVALVEFVEELRRWVDAKAQAIGTLAGLDMGLC